jgi:hypothetical protein
VALTPGGQFGPTVTVTLQTQSGGNEITISDLSGAVVRRVVVDGGREGIPSATVYLFQAGRPRILIGDG